MKNILLILSFFVVFRIVIHPKQFFRDTFRVENIPLELDRRSEKSRMISFLISKGM